MRVEKNKNRMNFALTEEIRTILKMLSVKKQISMSEIIRRSVELYEAQENEKKMD